MSESLLQVHDLRTYYATREGNSVFAVDGVSLECREGEILGIAGESGCGKSTLALSLMGMYFRPLCYDRGTIQIGSTEITTLSPEQLRLTILGNEIAYIPQAAMNVLNPTQRIIHFIRDIIHEHGLDKSYDEIYELARERFAALNLPERVLRAYPIELSGGMKQRVVIGISSILDPRILIADEPTSALDVSTQKAVIKTLKKLFDEGFVRSIIFITHELQVLRHIADRIAVMYAGQIVETGTMEQILFKPLHPYSKALMDSIVVPEKEIKAKKLYGIPGDPPNLAEPIVGCRFADRCSYVTDECRIGDIAERSDGQQSYRCIHEPEQLRSWHGQSN